MHPIIQPLTLDTIAVNSVATGIKNWLKHKASFVHFIECDTRDMTGLCCIYSLMCSAVLEAYNIATTVVFAHHHVYLTYSKKGIKHILDGTATQFGNVEVCNKEPIINKDIREFEKEVPANYKSYWTDKSLEFAQARAAATYAIQGGWTPEQCFVSIGAFKRAVEDCHQFLIDEGYMQEDISDDMSFATMLGRLR